MEKIPSSPVDSERTISDDFVANKADEVALEVESAEEERSDSEKTLEGDRFGQISGHGYTDGVEVDSASRAQRAAVKSEYLQVPLGEWLKEIDSGKGVWTAFKSFRSDGKTYDRYYFHSEYDRRFCSKPEVIEFIRYGTIKGKVVNKKRSVDTTTNDQDYRKTTKRQRKEAATSSNTSGSTGLTRGRIAPTRAILLHGFL